MFFWKSHIFLLAILYASFGSLTQVPLKVEPPPGDSKKPQLKYFTLDYKLCTNRLDKELAPKLDEIRAIIVQIDSAINDLVIKDELKEKYGIILKVYSILYKESFTCLEMIDYFKAKLGTEFLEFCMEKNVGFVSTGIILDLVWKLVRNLNHENLGKSFYLADCGKFYSDTQWVNSKRNVESLIFEKIRDDSRFFTWIFKNLLQYPDGRQVVPLSRFTFFLNETIEFNNKNYPQPTDPDIKAKLETRAQSLFNSMLTSLSTMTDKTEPPLDSIKELKNANEPLESFWKRLYYLPMFEPASEFLFPDGDSLFKVVNEKFDALNLAEGESSERFNYLRLLEQYGSFRYNQITSYPEFEINYILGEILKIYITFRYGDIRRSSNY
jgi:hypothetical protein